MAAVKWIKIVTDIFDDEKMLLIESLPAADSIIVIWFKLLCLAGKNNNSGVFIFNDRIPYTDEMLATIFRRELHTVRLALRTFEDFGMIEVIDDVITIPNWDKHHPYTDEMLATIFRRELHTVRLALRTFEDFGMIEVIDDVITIPNWDKHQSLDAYERRKEQDRIRKRRKKEEQKALVASISADCSTERSAEYSTEQSADFHTLEEDKEEDREEEKENIVSRGRAEAQTPTVIQLTTNKNEPYNITQAELDTFVECYPAVDIMQELRKMKAWLESNPTKRKTKGGMLRFVNNWLAREQDNGGTKRNGAAEQSPTDGGTAYNGNPTKRKTKGGMLRFVNNWLAREQDNGGTKRNGAAEQSPTDGGTAYNGIPLDVMRL